MAHPLFDRIQEIAQLISKAKPDVLVKLLHETLEAACHEALRDGSQEYGGLFAKVNTLCNKHNISVSDRIAIHTMRRNSNSTDRYDEEDFPYDLRALSIFVSAITGEAIPDFLLKHLPKGNRPYAKTEGLDVRYIRCIVNKKDNNYIYVTSERGLDKEQLAVDCSASHLNYIMKLAKGGMQMNLLDSKIDDTKEGIKVAVPRLVVVEPDYLIDISSIASCFKEYGHHALNYTIERLAQKTNSFATLLGGFAGSALDGMVNHEEDFDFGRTMRESFKEKALEYCTCSDLNGDKFKLEATNQANNIREAVDTMFGVYDRRKTILEPSFVCERLGLQGRVDLMTTDLRLLIEQKSGRNYNIETGRKGNHGSTQLEPHYVQLLLYYAVLRYNFNLNHDKTNIKLLYSKYPPYQGLIEVAFYQQLFYEAMKVRNQIVATDIKIAEEGFCFVLPHLTPDVLNTEKTTSNLYIRFQLPQIEAVTEPLQNLTTLEHDYFCRMMTFIYRERLISKVGAQEGVNSCMADLWNMPIAEKLETGNIYLGLTIKKREKTDGGNAFNIITLSVPKQGGGFLPNFRRGDMIFLYQYQRDSEPDVRRSILYKGNIKEIRSSELVVALMNGQQNPDIFKVQNGITNELYAVEHAGSDMSWSSAVRGLHELMTAPAHRKELLFGKRQPERDGAATLTRQYDGGYNDILQKAKQAKDYFLLIGPPGTGKTSMALKFLVEEELSSGNGSILLMAYTNRAVDEICSMLESADLDYIRLGNEYSADPCFKARLLSEIAKDCPKLEDTKKRIMTTRIITGTTSTLMARPFIFDIKSFSLAIIDEASQILEPNIVGLLAVHRMSQEGDDKCGIGRFIMIGDHKQLPAVVQQSEKVSSVSSDLLTGIGLDNCRNSLFERLLRIERKAGRGEFLGVLNRYGRMHPEVAEFPNQMFYSNERLVPVHLRHQEERVISYADIGKTDTLVALLRTHRMIFIPSRLCRRPDISDKVNTDEAAIVAQLLYRLRLMSGDSFDPSKSVGVIVPYRNQIAMIRQEVEKLGMEELENVSIDTVERYQGSQRDVIIYSFTVQNTWQLDFLTANCFMDEGHIIDRKLNVAMTRARCQMIMTGNETVLSTNDIFHYMIEYIRSKGGMVERKECV
ncbi:MAG: AAA domain-containing protein [Prevotella sp.]|nr:AAA domain-containing protein [Prevotella sp.]